MKNETRSIDIKVWMFGPIHAARSHAACAKPASVEISAVRRAVAGLGRRRKGRLP